MTLKTSTITLCLWWGWYEDCRATEWKILSLMESLSHWSLSPTTHSIPSMILWTSILLKLFSVKIQRVGSQRYNLTSMEISWFMTCSSSVCVPSNSCRCPRFIPRYGLLATTFRLLVLCQIWLGDFMKDGVSNSYLNCKLFMMFCKFSSVLQRNRTTARDL